MERWTKSRLKHAVIWINIKGLLRQNNRSHTLNLALFAFSISEIYFNTYLGRSEPTLIRELTSYHLAVLYLAGNFMLFCWCSHKTVFAVGETKSLFWSYKNPPSDTCHLPPLNREFNFRKVFHRQVFLKA